MKHFCVSDKHKAGQDLASPTVNIGGWGKSRRLGCHPPSLNHAIITSVHPSIVSFPLFDTEYSKPDSTLCVHQAWDRHKDTAAYICFFFNAFPSLRFSCLIYLLVLQFYFILFSLGFFCGLSHLGGSHVMTPPPPPEALHVWSKEKCLLCPQETFF